MNKSGNSKSDTESTVESTTKLNSSDLKQYWRENIKIVSILLTIWFVVGYCFSIFFIEQLNQIQIGNVGLGFWFAQQGSIYVFIVLVLVYALWMDRLDRKYGVNESAGGKQ